MRRLDARHISSIETLNVCLNVSHDPYGFLLSFAERPRKGKDLVSIVSSKSHLILLGRVTNQQ